MEIANDESRRKAGVRLIVFAILVAGGITGQLHFAMAIAALCYTVIEGWYLQVSSQRHDERFSEILASTDLLLRRGFIWILIILTVIYDLLIAQAFGLAIVTPILIYVAGVFTQSIRKREG